MTSIREWLETLGLGHYAGVFEDNAIEWQHLPELDHASLKELGVHALGHRMTLLRAAKSVSRGWEDGDSPRPGPPAGRVKSVTEAERRQLTVMFCDMVGSVELGERMDVEDYRELLARFRVVVVAAVNKHGGFIARHQGDGLLVYFGYPQAHEGDAEHAVRAGLDIIRAVRQLNHGYDVDVAVRVGIATGPVVVGDVLATDSSEQSEHAAFGSAPNLAARLQGQAAPNSLLISDTTFRLVGNLFTLISSPRLKLRGFQKEIDAYQIGAERPNALRFRGAEGDNPAPIIDRVEEFRSIADCCDNARRGKGQAVVLYGQPGIGKSRLVRAVADHMANEPMLALAYQCAPYATTSTLFPLLDQLSHVARLDLDDTPERRRRKLKALLRRKVAHSHVYSNVFDELEEIAFSTSRSPIGPRPSLDRLLDSLVDVLAHLARKSVVLLIIEDVHWADPSSLELIGRAIERISDLPILMLITHRLEHTFGYDHLDHVTTLTLGRLTAGDSASLTRTVAPGLDLPAGVVEKICDRCDGIPLFIEEITRGLIDSRAPDTDSGPRTSAQDDYAASIPATLHDSLMARLDRLGQAKQVAQVGAVLGRRFEHLLLEKTTAIPADALQASIAALMSSGIIAGEGLAPKATYTFKHALIQEAAYQSLLKSTRVELHERAARALVEHLPQIARSQPQRVAHHYTEAANPQSAIGFWSLAGQQALSRSASKEAMESVARGLALVPSISDEMERRRQELSLRVTLGAALMISQGQGTPEVENAYAKALTLANEIGNDTELFPALLGLWRYHIVRASLSSARQLAQRLLSVAEKIGDPSCLVMSRMALANSNFYLGETEQTLLNVERGLCTYQTMQNESKSSNLFFIGQDPIVSLEFCGALVNWLRGYAYRAEEHGTRGLSIARGKAHPFNLIMALTWSAILSQLGNRIKEVVVASAEVVSLSEEHDMRGCHGIGLALSGWARAFDGAVDEGIELIEKATRLFEGASDLVFVQFSQGLLADACRISQRTEEGFDAVESALSIVERTGVCWDEPRLLRLRAQLSAQRSDHAGAESNYRASIASARKMSMAMHDVSSSLLLGEFLYDAGQNDDAHEVLASCLSRQADDAEIPALDELRGFLQSNGQARVTRT